MKASQLAKILLKHPDAEVCVQEFGSEYVYPVEDNKPEIRVDSSGDKPKTVIIFNYETMDYTRIEELRPVGEKPEEHDDPVIIRSKKTGRIINMKW